MDINNLLKQMTTEEKVGQLVQLSAPFFSDNEDITGPWNEMNMTEEKLYNIGSVLGLSGAEKVINLQKKYLEKSRLKIPLLFMADIIHGDTTIFPIPLALGATWNPDSVRLAAKISAKEASIQGLHVAFSPMLDLVRDPRWGRVMESTGEDKFLNSILGRAFVEGYQGADLKNEVQSLASCIKHFAGYGAPRGGRDYNTVDLSENTFRDQYLPSYHEAIKSGAKMVMSSFNTIDNVPATANRKLMRNILREEMGFDGVLISDWGSVGELIPHRVAANLKDAAYLSINAGIDIEMMTAAYSNHLVDLANKFSDIMDLLDEGVLRVLKLKDELGLFENPYRGADIELEKTEVYSIENRKAAQVIAEESLVLLKNNNILPLNISDKVALTGPFKNSQNILGAWSWKGSVDRTKTLADHKPENVVVFDEHLVYEGLESFKLAFLDDVETIVVAVGEDPDMSGEAASRVDIRLPRNQVQLIKQLKSLNKKIVVILFNGRPLDLSEIIDYSDAILEAWYPGSEGAKAIWNVLIGNVNPSGKLTMSFPRNVGQIPVFYNEDSTGRPFNIEVSNDKYFSRYLDCKNSPLFPFGYGLSYSQFEIDSIEYSSNKLTKVDPIKVSVSIHNMSNIDGTEIIQMYIQDVIAEIARPVKELKGFVKVEIAAKSSKIIELEIKESDLRYIHSDNTLSSDPGKFLIGIGNSSDVQLNYEIELVR